MAIRTPEELQRATLEVSRLLQDIQNFRGRTWDKASRVRFPRGFIRTASDQRGRMPFVKNSVLRDNIAYTLILADVLHWNLVRTDLSGTAEQMLTKAHMFLLGSIVESLTKEFLKGRGSKSCYRKRLEILLETAVIDASLKEELEWLWEMRNRMHLFLIAEAEYNLALYSTAAHNRAVEAFKGLLAALNRAFEAELAVRSDVLVGTSPPSRCLHE